MNPHHKKFLARVYQSAKRSFICVTDDHRKIEAPALAVLLKEDHLVVGDRVEIEESAAHEFTITKVLPRTNQITRFIPREGKVKVTAANCDILAIIMSVSKPTYKRGLVDRYLIRAFEWNVRPILIFNKIDEYGEESPDLFFESNRLKKINVECFEISAKFPDHRPKFLAKGIEELKELLKDKTAICVGQSGVGKSKTIEALSGHSVELAIGDLAKVGKGAHTTTWAQIIDCKNFRLIDSPGIRSFSVEDVLEEDLIYYFPDLLEVARFCKFTSCEHNQQDRGCAFYKHNPDQKDQEILLSRLESFQRILKEVGEIPSWKKKKS